MNTSGDDIEFDDGCWKGSGMFVRDEGLYVIIKITEEYIKLLTGSDSRWIHKVNSSGYVRAKISICTFKGTKPNEIQIKMLQAKIKSAGQAQDWFDKVRPPDPD